MSSLKVKYAFLITLPFLVFFHCALGANGNKNISCLTQLTANLTATGEPVVLPYFEDFESNPLFGFTSGLTNSWVIGNATQASGDKGLYVSENAGEHNTYSIYYDQVVHAYKDFNIPTHAQELAISFDWRCMGEGEDDFFRVWLVPATYTPIAGTRISTDLAGAIPIGPTVMNQNTTFKTAQFIAQVGVVQGQTYRIIFEWIQDSSGGYQPAAAIDNLNIQVVSCSPPSDFVVSGVTSNTISTTWNAQDIRFFELYLTTSEERPNQDTRANHRAMTTNYVFSELNEGTLYYLWVRSVCGRDKSFWVGPIQIQTQLSPTALPYYEDFENHPSYGYQNDSHTKWIIGNAINNGGIQALYISNDNGRSNAYLPTVPGRNQVSHVYKDFQLPARAIEFFFNFDWRNVGEGSFDNFKVWLTPTTYNPQPGISIQEANPQAVQIGQEYYAGSRTFTTESIQIPAQAYLGRQMRVIFEWTQDASGGENPAAAIDNIAFFATNCLPPTQLTVNAIRGDAFDLNWIGESTQSSYDLFLTTDANSTLDESTVPTLITTLTHHTFANLEEGTMYYVWIRSTCSNQDKSLWSIPISVTTPLIHVDTLPYYEDFEDTLKIGVTYSLPNKWVVGNAVSQEGNNALYISNDNGLTNKYTFNKAQIVQAYKNFAIPSEVDELEISFDWRAVGEFIYDRMLERNVGVDYLKVWIVPMTYLPQANTSVSTAEGALSLQPEGFFNASEFRRFQTRFNISQFAGQNVRIVFEWHQDTRNGNQPPAAIDNLLIKPFNCQDIHEVQVSRESNSSQVEITWTPLGQEQSWEVYISESNQPHPTPLDAGILVENTPKYTFTAGVEGTFYQVFIRARCSDTDLGTWSPTTLFSLFNPPGCANIEIEPIDVPQTEDGKYILCGDETIQVELRANYYDIKDTSDYTVEAIEYKPPFPFTGGDMIPLTRDDYWSDVIDLGFDFCFYGNTYSKVLIGTNGMITFSVKGHTENGHYTPNTSSGYSMNATTQLPTNSSNPSTIPYMNSIFGVMQDLFPGNSPADYSVNYQILGTYPCRALVFNMYHLGLYDASRCPYDVNDIDGTTQTSQIVLYEGTNSIEVYIKNRPSCSAFNNGLGVVGIQNATATAAVTPPGRNVGTWTATNEAWRFTPNGASIAEFSWLKDGELYSKDLDISVAIDQSVTYTGRIAYTKCDGTEQQITKDFQFIKSNNQTGTLLDLYTCSREPGFIYTFDLTQNTPIALGELTDKEAKISYYETEEDVLADQNQLPLIYSSTSMASKRIYVKVEDRYTHCFTYSSFSLQVNQMPLATQVNNVLACQSYLLPALPEGEAYYTEPYGRGQRYEGGDVYTTVGQHSIYVYAVKDECAYQSKFSIEILEFIPAYQIEDQYVYCEVYRLPNLPHGNKYFTESDGEGRQLQAGEKILENQTIYIYAKNNKGTIACIDQSSFEVVYEECPLPKGFSPNGDGINDTLNLTNYGVTRLKIYNRNGVEIFNFNGFYTNEFTGKDKRGNQVPSGTYYYLLTSNGKTRTGWIEISK